MRRGWKWSSCAPYSPDAASSQRLVGFFFFFFLTVSQLGRWVIYLSWCISEFKRVLFVEARSLWQMIYISLCCVPAAAGAPSPGLEDVLRGGGWTLLERSSQPAAQAREEISHGVPVNPLLPPFCTRLQLPLFQQFRGKSGWGVQKPWQVDGAGISLYLVQTLTFGVGAGSEPASHWQERGGEYGKDVKKIIYINIERIYIYI